MSNDLINGLFETVGAVFLFGSLLKLRRDREVRGIEWKAVAFFFSFGVWNLWFYPSAGLYWSFCGGVLIALMNLLWLCHLAYYWLASRQPVALDLHALPTAEMQADSPLA